MTADEEYADVFGQFVKDTREAFAGLAPDLMAFAASTPGSQADFDDAISRLFRVPGFEEAERSINEALAHHWRVVALKVQAKNKGRPGWKSIEIPKLPKEKNHE